MAYFCPFCPIFIGLLFLNSILWWETKAIWKKLCIFQDDKCYEFSFGKNRFSFAQSMGICGIISKWRKWSTCYDSRVDSKQMKGTKQCKTWWKGRQIPMRWTCLLFCLGGLCLRLQPLLLHLESDLLVAVLDLLLILALLVLSFGQSVTGLQKSKQLR